MPPAGGSVKAGERELCRVSLISFPEYCTPSGPFPLFRRFPPFSDHFLSRSDRFPPFPDHFPPHSDWLPTVFQVIPDCSGYAGEQRDPPGCRARNLGCSWYVWNTPPIWLDNSHRRKYTPSLIRQQEGNAECGGSYARGTQRPLRQEIFRPS